MYNSTIRSKMGACPMCSHERMQPLTKGLCQVHYWQTINMKSANKYADKEVLQEDGLPELIEEADIVFSRFVRLSASDENGLMCCYICGSPIHYKQGQAMHFVPRANYFLRWDVRNVKAGDVSCNEIRGGNLVLFAKRLNQEHPGITDILWEESAVVFRPTREEVRKIISEYSTKVRILLRTQNT